MGSPFSKGLPTPEQTANFPYFVLDFENRDAMRLIFANHQIVHTVSSAVRQMWMCGVEKEKRLDNHCYEIRFFGSLFNHSSYHICCILMKRVMCKVFMDLYEIGWQPVVASSLTADSKLSAWFFYKIRSKMRPKSIVCLSLTSTDRIQLINAPENLKKCLKQSVVSGYGEQGLAQEYRYGDDYEIKLKGRPWNSFVFEENAGAKRAVLEIVRNFSRAGYQIYSTANMTGSIGCIFFVARNPWQLKGVEYFLMSFNRSDKLRLFGVDRSADVATVTRNAARCHWPGGYDRELEFVENSLVEFRLSEFAAGIERDAAQAFLCKLLESLSSAGWRVAGCLSTSQRSCEKGLFIMRSCSTQNISHCALTLSGYDRITAVRLGYDDHSAVERVLNKYGICKRRETPPSSRYYKLKGKPWGARSKTSRRDHLMARCVMCCLLKVMVDGSWKLIAATDTCPRYRPSGHNFSGGFIHNWIFVKMDKTAKARSANQLEPRSEPADILL